MALCCPSRASILSGQYSHHTRVERNSDGPLLRDAHTVGAWLRNGGYRTAFMGKYLNGYPFGRGPYVPPGWGRKQYRSLLAVDDMVRDLFTTLKARGELDNTVFFFATDNGYSFGEHRHVRKTCPYEECIRTPLLVRYPGQGAKRVRGLAQNVDLAPTMAELAGVRPSIPQNGRSLVPLLRGTSTSWRREVLLHWAGLPPGVRDPVDGVEIPAFWGIRTERYKYVELATGERELYDLRSDPNELANRAQQRSSSRLIAELRARLRALRGT